MKYLFLRKKQILIFAVICLGLVLYFFALQICKPLTSAYHYDTYLREYNEFQLLVTDHDSNHTNIAIFSVQDSYAIQNAEKTYDDYADCTDITIQKLNGSENAVSAFLNFKILPFVCCSFVILFHMIQYKARTTSGRKLEFSLLKGRLLLVFHRLWINYIIVWVILLLLNLLILICSFSIYGGWTDLTNPLQSMNYFMQIPHNITLWKYLLWLCVWRAFGIVALGMLFLMLLHIIEHKMVTVFVFILASVGEFVIFRAIPVQGKWILLKIINLRSLIFPEDIMRIYRNVLVLSKLLSMETIYYYITIIVTIIAGIMIAVFSVRYETTSYPRRLHFFITLGEKIKTIRARLEAQLSWLLMEIYIFLVHRRGLIIFLLVFMLTAGFYHKHDIVYSPENYYLSDFYNQWEGTMSNDLIAYMDEWEQKLKDVEFKWKNIEKSFSDNTVTFSVYENARYEYLSYEVERSCFEIISQKIAYIQNVYNETGKKLWLLDEIGYNYLFGKAGFKSIYFLHVLLWITSCIVSISFVRKKNDEINYLYQSCRFGRKKRFVKKVKAAIVIMVILCLVCYLAHLSYVNLSYGLSGWNAPIQSLFEFQNLRLSVSILLFYMLLLVRNIAINIILVIITSIVYTGRGISNRI